jgi:hypothetical protein
VSFVNRAYPDVVRDVLTVLTQGIAREVHRVDYNPQARPLVVPEIVLKRRPVHRVSLVSGLVETGVEGAEPRPYEFTLNDYEQTPDPSDPEDLSRIRFLPFGRKPAPGTDVVVNYYPRVTDPTPLTDLNVGSVVRTLLEAVSREMALLYAQLNLAYDSAFLETATGSSLDRVVALLGCQRFRAGRPVGAVTFGRRAGSTGNITIPAGTPITDAQDTVRYETIESYTLLAGETTAQVRIRGATQTTEPVAEGTLTVIQRSIAGLDTVSNERPTTRASDDESDEELRRRAAAALLASNKGTVPAIRHGLLQMPQVRDVSIIEMPNGVPGEIRLVVSMAEPGASTDPVLARIEELRPAGIRVLLEGAGSLALQAQVQLVLAGSQMPATEVQQVHNSARDTLVGEIRKKGVGDRIRIKPLVAALLADGRIVDAQIILGVKGGAVGQPGEDFTPDAKAAVSLAPEDVSFGAEVFDQPLAGARRIVVEVRTVIGAQPQPGTVIDAVNAQITSRLKQFFSALGPGTSVTAETLLTALRDDAKYAIDPMRMAVTLTAGDQFVQIVQGGPAFDPAPEHVFDVVSVEVTA